jgi:lipopolysaccharide transport system ATP-binding protein
MSIRLAFALATAVQPQILLMDEWFSAGDEDFMAKADIRLEYLIKASEILVIATHDMDVVKRWCNRVIRLEAGRIVGDGGGIGL